MDPESQEPLLHSLDYELFEDSQNQGPVQEDDENELITKLYNLVDHRKRGFIDFEDLQRMMETQIYSQNTAGKYFVVVSLSEAETLRSILHSVQHKTINEGKSSFALRLGSTIIDKSTTHEFAGPYQTDTALQCLRFLDSDTKYEERDISLLLRAIQINKKKDRDISI